MTDLEKELVEELAKLTDIISEIPAGTWKVTDVKVCSAGETIPVLTRREIDLILPLIRSHTQALVAAAYAACAEAVDTTQVEGEDEEGNAIFNMPRCCAHSLMDAAGRVHSLTPTAAARELERREDVLIREALQIGQWVPQRTALNYDVLIKKVREQLARKERR